jgi:hypothetical protein
MTGVAIQCGVRTQQWKSVFVLLNLLYCDLPSLYGMTLLAIGAKLATVNIRVAVRALGPDIRENGFGVALLAGDAFMHAAQGKFCAIMIKLRDSADRFPARYCVAILAGNFQITVRAAADSIRLRLRNCSETCH